LQHLPPGSRLSLESFEGKNAIETNACRGKILGLISSELLKPNRHWQDGRRFDHF
jgi:hypothetical protein